MRHPPRVATAVLLRLAPDDESLLGDLIEEYASGRSRGWYWRQVMSAVLLGAVRAVRSHPVRVSGAVAAGWLTLLALFTLFGDRTADGLAAWGWGWNRQEAYADGDWWPFRITSSMVSYGGFALSGLVVGRLQRRLGDPLVVVYSGSVLIGLAIGAITIEILTSLWGRVPVPHLLFYAVAVSLPYHLRSGLVLAPLVILAAGMIAAAPRDPQSAIGESPRSV
jgi:hypothetical protein